MMRCHPIATAIDAWLTPRPQTDNQADDGATCGFATRPQVGRATQQTRATGRIRHLLRQLGLGVWMGFLIGFAQAARAYVGIDLCRRQTLVT